MRLYLFAIVRVLTDSGNQGNVREMSGKIKLCVITKTNTILEKHEIVIGTNIDRQIQIICTSNLKYKDNFDYRLKWGNRVYGQLN